MVCGVVVEGSVVVVCLVVVVGADVEDVVVGATVGDVVVVGAAVEDVVEETPAVQSFSPLKLTLMTLGF